MKRSILAMFRLLIMLVLLGKILNWVLHFSEITNRILNTAMFGLIGIAYLVMGFVWNHTPTKIAAATCGILLMVMNFLPQTAVVEITGIACLVIPMALVKMSGYFESREKKPLA